MNGAFEHSSNGSRLRGQSDRRLVELARTGDPDAFEEIVVRYRQPLLGHCRRMLRPAEAEDAVQETFLSAFRAIGRTRRELHLGAWLFRIAHHAALAHLDRYDASHPLDDAAQAADALEETVVRRERLRETLAALAALPEAQRRAIVERTFAGRGHREIATMLGRSEGGVRQLLHRARTHIRDCVTALTPVCGAHRLWHRLARAGEAVSSVVLQGGGYGVTGTWTVKATAVVGITLGLVGGGLQMFPRPPFAGNKQTATRGHHAARIAPSRSPSVTAARGGTVISVGQTARYIPLGAHGHASAAPHRPKAPGQSHSDAYGASRLYARSAGRRSQSYDYRPSRSSPRYAPRAYTGDGPSRASESYQSFASDPRAYPYGSDRGPGPGMPSSGSGSYVPGSSGGPGPSATSDKSTTYHASGSGDGPQITSNSGPASAITSSEKGRDGGSRS